MARKKFGDVQTPGEAPAELLKFAIGQKYYLKIVSDFIEEYDEIWPTIQGSEGLIKRRFVGNEDNTNLDKILEYKEGADIPKENEGNWKVKHQYAVLVVVGHAEKKKKNGKTRTVVKWEKEVKIWVFGIKTWRQLKSLNEDDELKERAEEGGYDMEEKNVINVYSLTLTKEKTGSKAFNVDYNIKSHKLVGDIEDLEDYDEVDGKLKEYTKPNKKSEVASFIERFGEGIGEADSEDEEEDEDEAPKKKKKSKKSKKPVVEDDEDEDVEEDEDEDEDEEEKPKKKSKSKSKKPVEDEDEEEIDPDDDEDEDVEEDEDEDEDEEEKPKKKSKSKSKKPVEDDEDEDEEEIDPDDDEDEIEEDEGEDEEEEEQPKKKKKKKSKKG